MIQKGTFLNVVDNSGAKDACCIHIYGGYRKRYANTGDVILVSIKTLRKKEKIKVKKGDVSKALVVKTKKNQVSYSKNACFFFENSILLITNQNKFIGNKVFTSVEKKFRYTRYLRILSMSSGIIK